MLSHGAEKSPDDHPKIVCWWSVNTYEIFPSSLILINNGSLTILKERCWKVYLNEQLEFVTLKCKNSVLHFLGQIMAFSESELWYCPVNGMNTAAQQEIYKIPQALSNDSVNCPLQDVGKGQGSGVSQQQVPGRPWAAQSCSLCWAQVCRVSLWYLLAQLGSGLHRAALLGGTGQ